MQVLIWMIPHHCWIRWILNRRIMLLPDVNILVYAHREDSSHHAQCLGLVEKQLNTYESFSICELCLR